MKKYSFRLQRVLDIKNVMQKVRERELAKALTALEIEEKLLEEQKKTRSIYQDEVRGKRSMTVYEMRFYSMYFTFLQDEIENQLHKISARENEVDKSKKNLTEAYREKKVIENLKSRSKQEYSREYDKEEQFQNDEISMGTFFKKQM